METSMSHVGDLRRAGHALDVSDLVDRHAFHEEARNGGANIS
jgi:hypothetical protein